MRTQSFLSKGVTAITCFLQWFKACQRVGKHCGEKIKLQVYSGDFWHRELGGRKSWGRASSVIKIFGSTFGFLWLVLSWKLGRGNKDRNWQPLIKSSPFWTGCCRGCAEFYYRTWSCYCLLLYSQSFSSEGV